MTLTSGDTVSSDGSCFPRVDPGDTSIATAFFGSDGRVLIYAKAPGPECFECFQFWEDLLKTLTETANPQCPSTSCGGTGGSGGSGTGGSGGTAGGEYCASYTLFSTDCFPAPEFRKDVTLDFSGSTMAYIMTIGGLPETNDATDFTVGAAGTWNDTTGTGTGTGDFVVGEASDNCDAPQARLRFDIEFDEELPKYTGMINFDFTLDANCGSSICFASAEVTGTEGACP